MKFRNPFKLLYYIKNYLGQYYYSHKLSLSDTIHLWWIIEG